MDLEDLKEIDIKELIITIKKRFWIVITITAVATIASGIISLYILTPIYEASTEILVNKSDSNISNLYSYNDIQADLKLINTYKVIIKSPRIIDMVISQYNLDYSFNELIRKIRVNTVADSQVISISVIDTDYQKAVMLVNVLADTFKDEIVKIMKVDNVHILAEAKTIDNPSPIKPQYMLNIIVAFSIGLIISLCLIFLLEHFDNSIKSEIDVERILGYSVLGSISLIDKKEVKKEIRKLAKKKVAEGENI